MSTKKSSTKYAAVVTYCIALACMLLGLFLPVYNGGELLFMALPDAFCKAFAGGVSSLGNSLTREFIISYGNFSYDLAALLVSLYAAVTAAGVIMLIPVIACNSKKKAANVCAYIVEVAAVLVLFAYAYMQLIGYASANAAGAAYVWDYGLIGIALGGTALMLILQSVIYKKRSGLIKLLMAVLGAVAALSLLDIPAIFGFTRQDVFGGGIYVGYYNDVSGTAVLDAFFREGGYFFGTTTAKATTGAIMAILALLAIFNFALDVVQMSTNTAKGWLVFDIIRYGAEVLLSIISIVMLFVLNVQDLSPGLMMVIIFAASLIQTALAAVRCGLFRTVKPEGASSALNAPVPAQVIYTTAPYSNAQPVQPMQPPQTYQPAPAGEVVYAPKEVYGGPTDDFIAKLTDSEKIEFCKTFIEKQKGPCTELPDYVVGGDNKEFFSAIFLYLGKYRPLISDGLMGKIYQQLGA